MGEERTGKIKGLIVRDEQRAENDVLFTSVTGHKFQYFENLLGFFVASQYGKDQKHTSYTKCWRRQGATPAPTPAVASKNYVRGDGVTSRGFASHLDSLGQQPGFDCGAHRRRDNWLRRQSSWRRATQLPPNPRTYPLREYTTSSYCVPCLQRSTSDTAILRVN
ncbi:hypothetical protein CBL_02750 [Carabus blaptoides fortunei]